MINLISEEQKNLLRRNYRMRMIVLIITSMCVFVGLSLAFVLPSFFLSQAKEKIAIEKLDKLKNSESVLSSQELEAIISDVNSKLGFIKSSQKDSFIVSQNAVDQILKKKTDQIKIKEIFYDFSQSKRVMDIRGLATDREALLSFSRSIEALGVFTKVDLPISNFVKSKDIDFAIKISI